MTGTLTPGGPQINGAAAPEQTPPPTERERADQAQFDAVVNRDSKIAMQLLTGVAILAALIMSAVALTLSANAGNTTATVTRTVAAAPAGAAAAPLIELSITGGNKTGPDGKLHDSFSKTNFAVKVGQPVRLRIDNTDATPHTITAAGTGVGIVAMPGVHTYTMTATTAGRFEWVCIIPCDSDAKGWAMTHPGYMAGYITAT